MTFLKRSAAPFLLSCLALTAALSQSKENRPDILFTVNDKPVYAEEFVYLYRKNHQHKPEEFTREKIEEYLQLFINYKLKVEEARSRGMDTTAAFRKEFETYRNELLKPHLPSAEVIDSLVRLTYDRLKEEVSASHILIRLEPDASPADTLAAYQRISELRTRALSGEDFGSLAARFSEEPGAAQSQGNLGFFTAMQMVYPFEQAAYLTPVGGISQPVRTRFGYHIVKVSDRRPSSGEVEVSHIMIRTGEHTDDKLARNTIFDLYDKLRKGMDWDEVCRQYSEDANTKMNGGRLKPFGVGGMASVPEFQDMAFSLNEPGDISDPVQTRFGWHILRLEKRIPLPSFEEIRPSLTQRVSRDERVRISQEALRRRMRAEFNYTESSVVKDRLLQQAATVVADPSVVRASMGDEVIFTMQGKPHTVSSFIEFLADQPGPTDTAAAGDFIREQLNLYADDVQLRLMEEKVKRESPDYRWLLKEYYEGILLFEIMEKEVWNRSMEDSAGQRAFFERNSGRYRAGERVIAEIYSSAQPEAISGLKPLLESNDSTLAEFISRHRIRLDSGSFERDERPMLALIPWQPGVHSTDHNGVHYLVHAHEILPPGQETFEEARASVISDYQTFLEDSWITELKRKFEVKVEKKAKRRAFAELLDNK